MPNYRVTGASRETGVEIEIELVAQNPYDAERQANNRGLMVAKVVEVTQLPEAKMETSATPPVSRLRLGIAGTSAIGMLGTFMPWVSIPMFGSVSGARGDGWFSFIGFAVALAVSLSPNLKLPIKIIRRSIAGVMGLGCAALGIWKIVGLLDLAKEQEAEGGMTAVFATGTQIGFGLWIVAFSGLAVLVMAIAVRNQK
jgi:hypothetical protein